MLPSISIYYFHAFYFKRFNSISLKLLSADGMFIFMNTLVAYMVPNKISLIDSTTDVTRKFCLNGCSAILPLREAFLHAFLTDCHRHPMTMCQPLFFTSVLGSGLNCVSGGPTRLMNIRLDKITVNNIIGVRYTEKTTGTTFPLYTKERERRSRPTRTLPNA